MPLAWMERPDGVKYRAVVSLIGWYCPAQRDHRLDGALAETCGAHDDRAPWSCRAPATISEAEAEPPLISTTIGTSALRRKILDEVVLAAAQIVFRLHVELVFCVLETRPSVEVVSVL